MFCGLLNGMVFYDKGILKFYYCIFLVCVKNFLNIFIRELFFS